VLLGIIDDSVFAKFEQYEIENPCPRKEIDDRTIYLSRPMPLTKGEPSIADLSEARFGDSKHKDRIMPKVYRAPEVILGVPWSFPVDVWGFGMVGKSFHLTHDCDFSPLLVKCPLGKAQLMKVA
jgi:serine/threonine-protein kinase SRPK3